MATQSIPRELFDRLMMIATDFAPSDVLAELADLKRQAREQMITTFVHPDAAKPLIPVELHDYTAAAPPELHKSGAGEPLHDAEHDPTAAIRRDGPGPSIVAEIAELELLASMPATVEGSLDAYMAAAPRYSALCHRALEMIDLLEATSESLSQVLDFRAEVLGSLRELDERVAIEVPAAMTAIAETLGPLEVTP